MKLKSFSQFLYEQTEPLRVRGNIISDRYKDFMKMDLDIEYLDGNFDCYFNNLTSLKGCPTTVNGYFNCSKNNLISLEGSPTTVTGQFYCYNQKNGYKFTVEDVRAVCDVKGKIYA